MKKSIVALGMVLALSGCAAAADETLAAEPAALVEISPATEENAQPGGSCCNRRPCADCNPCADTRTDTGPHARADSRAYGSPHRRTHASPGGGNRSRHSGTG